MKPNNPLARYEYRLAREQRRLAVIDLRKTEVQSMDGHYLQEVLIVRTIASRLMVVLIVIFIVIGIASINDVFQNHDDQAQVTACERAVTQANETADCSSGKIGAVKK